MPPKKRQLFDVQIQAAPRNPSGFGDYVQRERERKRKELESDTANNDAQEIHSDSLQNAIMGNGEDKSRESITLRTENVASLQNLENFTKLMQRNILDWLKETDFQIGAAAESGEFCNDGDIGMASPYSNTITQEQGQHEPDNGLDLVDNILQKNTVDQSPSNRKVVEPI